ncbi:hypothetical protein R6V09_00300 [Streptomyces sp. W16]|uniref:hypothetical protein n=1 Tax=Streptomyces sp. W16 TaxID=3076631 RepID=UPI00295BF6BA|nr:hypothetical protein [Streptomyces sp. W16]MDV9168585.1 hypothetical protein [Streptomyces sp. W16]
MTPPPASTGTTGINSERLPATGGGQKGRQFVLGQERIIGPQGGCVGLEQTVTVALPPCPPCTTRELV